MIYTAVPHDCGVCDCVCVVGPTTSDYRRLDSSVDVKDSEQSAKGIVALATVWYFNVSVNSRFI